MKPPRWLKRACLGGLILGLVLVVLGPVLFSLAVKLNVSEAPADAAREFGDVRDDWRPLLYVTTPLGMGLLFSSVIGLLFLWVTQAATHADSTPEK